MSKLNPRVEAWQKRKRRVRRRVKGSPARPRLSVFRSSRHIYAQLIDDTTGSTLAAVSTLSPDYAKAVEEAKAAEAARAAEEAKAAEAAKAEAEAEGDQKAKAKKGKGKKKKKAEPVFKAKIGAAQRVGLLIAQKAKDKGVSQVVFDRNGFLYHGRIKAVADGARKGGLEF